MKASKQLLLMQIHIFTDKADCFSRSFKIQTGISWIYSPVFTEVQKCQCFLFLFFLSLPFPRWILGSSSHKKKNKSMRCLHLLSLHLWQQETKMCLEAASKLVFYLEKNCMRQKRTMSNKHNHLWDLIIPLQYFSLEMYHNCMFLHSQVTYTCCLSCGNQVF